MAPTAMQKLATQETALSIELVGLAAGVRPLSSFQAVANQSAPIWLSD